MAHVVTAGLSAQVLFQCEPVLRAVVTRWHLGHTIVGLSIALGQFLPAHLLQRLRSALFRFSERVYDWRYGIFSEGEILASELGFTEKSCHDYMATGYIRFRQLMSQIEIRDNDVFLDYGSGLGRAVILAATYPFRKVIGVELAADLHKRAAENVRRAVKRLRCRDIELYNVDARRFRIPPEVTVIYLWNPFDGEVLREVFDNIQRSIVEHPRPVTVLHLSPRNPTPLDEMKDSLPWLKESKRIRFGAQSLAVFYTCGAAEASAALSTSLSALAQAT
ncbi:MAG TPA: class I SAM-dependent methyltransferase [Candidatus Binatia bacterium]|jgi:SAM-dependent methyltransferase